MTELPDKVKAWLEGEGYPLEFATANAFERSGFETRQGMYLSMPRTNAFREIDVVASRMAQNEEVTCRVSIVVECKWSRDKPWVVFTSRLGRSSWQEKVAYVVSSPLGAAALWNLMRDDRLRQLRFFEPSRRIGFSGRQAFSDKQDLFYSTVQGIVSAAISYARTELAVPQTNKNARGGAHVVFPLVVLDAPLFECYFEDGNLKVDAVESVQVQWRGSDVVSGPVIVDIVTAEALANYVDMIASHADALLYALRSSAERVIKALNTGMRSELEVLPDQFAHVPVPTVLRPVFGLPPLDTSVSGTA
jgi:hypothetical protein